VVSFQGLDKAGDGRCLAPYNPVMSLVLTQDWLSVAGTFLIAAGSLTRTRAEFAGYREAARKVRARLDDEIAKVPENARADFVAGLPPPVRALIGPIGPDRKTDGLVDGLVRRRSGEPGLVRRLGDEPSLQPLRRVESRPWPAASPWRPLTLKEAALRYRYRTPWLFLFHVWGWWILDAAIFAVLATTKRVARGITNPDDRLLTEALNRALAWSLLTAGSLLAFAAVLVQLTRDWA
jgi:hypothetical protein